MEWISVKERLPEYNEEVLIAMRYTELPLQAYYGKTRNKWYGSKEVRDNMIDGFVGDPEFSCQEYITHWMPLPELPQLTT